MCCVVKLAWLDGTGSLLLIYLLEVHLPMHIDFVSIRSREATEPMARPIRFIHIAVMTFDESASSASSR